MPVEFNPVDIYPSSFAGDRLRKRRREGADNVSERGMEEE